MNSSIDTPKSLGEPEHKLEREEMLRELEDQCLTRFVEAIRRDPNCGGYVPNFDPADGGVNAECLFLLEAPGRKAVKSGFVSRNNPDETAKNWFKLNAEVGIPRHRTLMWNIVPWYLGQNGLILPANNDNIDAGWKWLLELLNRLRPYKRLRIVVLVGRNAQKVRLRLERELELEARKQDDISVKVMECFHPSPSFINRNKDKNWGTLLDELKNVADALK